MGHILVGIKYYNLTKHGQFVICTVFRNATSSLISRSALQ